MEINIRTLEEVLSPLFARNIMPTISPISITPTALAAGQGLATPSALPPPTIVSPEALDALLHSPPDPAREAKKPDDEVQPGDRSTLEQGLADLKRTDKSTVNRALCDPNANSSAAFISTLNTVFTKENVDTLLRSPPALAQTAVLSEIGTHLNTDTINAVLSPLETEQIETYRKCVDSALFGLKYQLFSAPVGARFDLVRRFAGNKQGALTDIESRLGGLGTTATNLFNIAAEVKRVNESLQYSHPDDWDRRRNEPDSAPPANIYRYLNTRESSLDAPSEIRDFVHGRDKLDVSGIRKQLNKKLHWVNQLSGASGEMQLKYSPTHDASVLVISGNQGDPAFVAKIVGKFRETDLVA